MIEADEFPQVLETTEGLLRDAQKATGADSAETAEAIEVRLKALFLGGVGDKSEMLKLAERGLAIRERLLGPDDPGRAAMLEARSDAFLYLQDFPRSLADRRQAKAIREKAFGPESLEVARTQLRMVEVMAWNPPDHDEAEKLVTQAAAIIARTAGPDSTLAGRAHQYRGFTFEAGGQYPEARAAYEQALRIYETKLPSDHSWISECLYSLGELAIETGDFLRARTVLERAAVIAEKKFHGTRRMTGLLMALGAAQAESGDVRRAIDTLSRAVANADAAGGPESMGAGIARNRLAVAYLMAGEISLAVAPCERALVILEKLLGPDDMETISTRNNLGFILLDMGDYAASRPHLEQAYAASLKALPPRSTRRADIASSLADLELAEGNLDRAEALYSEAQVIRMAVFGPDHPAVARILGGMARVDLAAGRPIPALDKALRVERIARTDFHATARSLTEREALRYEAIRTSGIDLAMTALEDEAASRAGSSRDIRRAWDAMVHSRAMVLDEMTERRRFLSVAQDGETQKLVQRLTEARDRLAHLTVAGQGGRREEFASRVQAARLEKQRAESALATVSADFRRLNQRSAAGLEQVLRALPPATALVAYVHYERPRPVASRATVPDRLSTPAGRDRKIPGTDSYAAFVLSAGAGVPVFVPLGPSAPIEAAVHDWQDAAAGGKTSLPVHGDPDEQRYRSVADQLRRLVWDPIQPRIGRATQVLIVPDGALGLVSFAALPTGTDRYLVETGPTIHYLSAERDVAAHGVSAPVGLGMMALGGPDFDASPADQARKEGTVEVASTPRLEGSEVSRRAECPDLVSVRFETLPGARLEAEELAALWRKAAAPPQAARGEGEVLVRVGAQASEASVKHETHGRRIVHLATHAFVAGSKCASSIGGLRGGRLALAAEDMLGVVGDNPLLLSGLALAGANRREQAGPDQDDGILTGEEIASLDFTGTEWIVLSACDTGVGTVQHGEGILDLRRAFETSGTQTLIMSLWSVGDEATRQWMRSLYLERLSGKSTAESVRGADQAILVARRQAGKSTHPFFWGGFVATGGWR
jgi:CHAT domain-containing protein/tetratricopeptide (TPR) repeat protein